MRIGHGFDLHRLEPLDDGGVALGGVRIACAYRVIAHSDGDVVIHALCDALLGAIAAGDIGQHFPDTDPRWRGADSRVLLADVVAKVHAAGYRVGNADATVLAEVPRVAPHVPAMRAALASCLQVPADAVSVKATTLEGLGDIGGRRALAAHAVVLLLGA
jgi:2-C-methyl-D-erythritol 2,4-cyclodiphosphate synthase